VLAADQQLTTRALALRDAGLPGTVEELRARAYLDALLDRASTPPATAPPAPRPSPAVLINLTVPLTTQLGLADDPGLVAGFGPVDGPLARPQPAAPVLPDHHRPRRAGHRPRLPARIRRPGRTRHPAPHGDDPPAGPRLLRSRPPGTRLPAQPHAPAPHLGPHPDLHRTRLPTVRHPLRPRPHDALRPGWADLRVQPGPAVPS